MPGCDFFGTAETRYYCSKCFNCNLETILKEVDVPPTQLPQQTFMAPVTSGGVYGQPLRVPDPQPYEVPIAARNSPLTGDAGGQEPPKCPSCQQFFACEEFGGLCHGCFMKTAGPWSQFYKKAQTETQTQERERVSTGQQQQSGLVTATTHAQSRLSSAPPIWPSQKAEQSKRQVQVADTKVKQVESESLVTEQRVLEADRGPQLAEPVEKAIQKAQSLFKQATRTAEDAKARAEDSERKAEDCKRRAEAAERKAEDAKKKAEDSEKRAEAAERKAEDSNRRAEAAERRAEAVERHVVSVESALTRRIQELVRSLQNGQSDTQEKPFWVVQREEIQITKEEIGRGGWGAIVVALFRGQRVAAKSLHNQIISPHNLRLFTREMNMAARVRHPNLLQFIGATTEGEPIILTELMHTSLRNVLAYNPLSWAQIISIFSDVVRALNYLHLMQPSPIIHRDISSANVLLEPSSRTTWKAKVSDFGSTNFVSQMATTGPGNPLYAAPEAYNPYQQSPKMDIFSCGILLIETCTRQLPPVEEREEMIGQISWPAVVPLVWQCIQEDKDRRPTSQDILRQFDLLSGQR